MHLCMAAAVVEAAATKTEADVDATEAADETAREYIAVKSLTTAAAVTVASPRDIAAVLSESVAAAAAAVA